MGTGKYSINEREFRSRYRRYEKPYDSFVYWAHHQLLEEIYDDIERMKKRYKRRLKGRCDASFRRTQKAKEKKK